MEVVRSLEQVPQWAQGGVLSIGNFDGVHLGHKALLGQNIKFAESRGLKSILLTFDPHPVKVLHPSKGLRELFPLQDSIEQLDQLGLDLLVIEKFDLEFSRQSPEDFAKTLEQKLKPSHLVLGDDFRFGNNRSGGFAEFEELGRKFGFSVEKINPVDFGGVRISSSMIRNCLSSGDVRVAAQYLGRPFELRGQVVTGEQRGRRLGFPTANLDVLNEIVPKVGVYVTELVYDGSVYQSLTNIGYRPTFEGETDTQRLSVEAYIIKGDLDLYDADVRLRFLERVRPELKFSSSNELIKQIEQDVRFAEEYFARKVQVD